MFNSRARCSALMRRYSLDDLSGVTLIDERKRRRLTKITRGACCDNGTGGRASSDGASDRRGGSGIARPSEPPALRWWSQGKKSNTRWNWSDASSARASLESVTCRFTLRDARFRHQGDKPPGSLYAGGVRGKSR